MRLLNIGCGATWHPAWTNIDMASSSPQVQVYDIRQGIPYPDGSFDACYTSHLLEHLAPAVARFLIGEAWRVLRPQGVVRVVVPDLEGIARHYLQTLEAAEQGTPGAAARYDWMMLELFDQTVRATSGGEMHHYLTTRGHEHRAFLRTRLGQEAERYWAPAAPARRALRLPSARAVRPLLQRLRQRVALRVVGLVAGGAAREAFAEGLFRHAGEIHRWMYDRFSLRRLLTEAGFGEVQVCRADESRIPGFASYELDTVGGQVRKPDSLFIEGIKP